MAIKARGGTCSLASIFRDKRFTLDCPVERLEHRVGAGAQDQFSSTLEHGVVAIDRPGYLDHDDLSVRLLRLVALGRWDRDGFDFHISSRSVRHGRL